MTKTTLITLAVLGLTAAAHASPTTAEASKPDAEVLTLPRFTVTAPRQSAAEKAVTQSLEQFRTQTLATPVTPKIARQCDRNAPKDGPSKKLPTHS